MSIWKASNSTPCDVTDSACRQAVRMGSSCVHNIVLRVQTKGLQYLLRSQCGRLPNETPTPGPAPTAARTESAHHATLVWKSRCLSRDLLSQPERAHA